MPALLNSVFLSPESMVFTSGILEEMRSVFYLLIQLHHSFQSAMLNMWIHFMILGYKFIRQFKNFVQKL
ncbi:hypothetical protein PTKIN_Ptkin05aG0084500 [Pterospermum kingtungense]